MGLFHNARTTTKLRGYQIPKNTVLMYNIYAIHMDPKYWDDPTQFQPERFLDKHGQYHRPEAFIPFGIGRLAFMKNNNTLRRVHPE